MEIRRLENFDDLEQVFAEEFESDVPLPENTEIFGLFDGDELLSFVVAEKIILLGQLYVAPEHRKMALTIAKKMLNFLQSRYDGKEVVGAVASERRFEPLFEAYGMQRIDGTFHRKNIDF